MEGVGGVDDVGGVEGVRGVEDVGGVVKAMLVHTVAEIVFKWVWCVCTVKCDRNWWGSCTLHRYDSFTNSM